MRSFVRPLLALGLIALPCSPPVSARGVAGAAEAPNSGEDLTRPTHRIDVRAEMEGEEDEESLTLTLRYDHPVQLGDGWQANLRIDLPFVSNSEISADNPFGHDDADFGDVLLQTIFVRHVSEVEGFGIGTQLIAPTAGGEAFGRGKWRLRPTAGYRWSVPSITEGTYFQLLARYDFSFAGDDDRDDVRELQFAPNLEIELPGEAYVSIFPSTDIRYNFVHDEFFLPLNLEAGKSWGRLVVSVEGGVGLISGDRPPYDWKLEGRMGFASEGPWQAFGDVTMPDENPVHGRSPVLPSDMGEKRTIMAADRTLMAWIRTSLSMYSFGFTIYKFLDTMAEQGQLERTHSPQMVGMFLAALGTLTIIFGTISYWVTLKDLQRVEMFRLGRPIMLMALIMCLTGGVLFAGIALRIV